MAGLLSNCYQFFECLFVFNARTLFSVKDWDGLSLAQCRIAKLGQKYLLWFSSFFTYMEFFFKFDQFFCILHFEKLAYLLIKNEIRLSVNFSQIWIKILIEY